MRVQTEEWRRFIPGVRMYKGKMTLFWNGQPLGRNMEERQKWEEQQKWEVIIVLPGVEIIPDDTFGGSMIVETVIMSDTVRRIGWSAFNNCYGLKFVKLSRNLEYIGDHAFENCDSLPSIFIPPSCREIGNGAFDGCENLIILSVAQNTQLGENVIAETSLIEGSPFLLIVLVVMKIQMK